jgi:glutamine phosphoribosylpyrophosphate amidotransferase
LYFLSLKGLIESIGVDENLLCTSCFSGQYPIDLKERANEVKEPVYASGIKPQGALF